MKPSRSQLVAIAQLIDEGRLRVLLSKIFPLERAREAFEYAAHARKPGKVVLEVVRQAGEVVA